MKWPEVEPTTPRSILTAYIPCLSMARMCSDLVRFTAIRSDLVIRVNPWPHTSNFTVHTVILDGAPAWLASPLHTCSCRGIIWLQAVFSSLGSAVKTATNYNGDKPKRRQPEQRQNGKAKTATHLNDDNKNGDSLWIGLRCLRCDNLVTWVRLISRRWIRFCKGWRRCYVHTRIMPLMSRDKTTGDIVTRLARNTEVTTQSTVIVRLAEPLSWLQLHEQAIALFKRRNGFNSLLQSWVMHNCIKIKLQCPKWISQCAGT